MRHVIYEVSGEGQRRRDANQRRKDEAAEQKRLRKEEAKERKEAHKLHLAQQAQRNKVCAASVLFCFRGPKFTAEYHARSERR